MQLFLGNEGKEPWTKLNWICWCYANKCLSVLGWRKQPAPYTVQVTCSQLTQWKQQIQRKALHLPWIKLGGVFKENRFYFWQTSHWAEGILHGRVNTPLTLREDPYTPIQQQPAGLQSSEHRKAALCALPPPFPFHHQPTQVPSSTAGQQTLISVTPPGTPWLNSLPGRSSLTHHNSSSHEGWTSHTYICAKCH